MSESIETKVMRRVYIAHTLRRVFSPLMIKVYIGIILAWRLVASVSVSDVIANLFAKSVEPAYAYNFTVQAFVNTNTGVQVMTLLIVGLTGWLFVDLFKKRGSFLLKR